MIERLNRFLKKYKLQIKSYPEKHIKNRFKIINANNINLLLDVGANAGQFGKRMREYGFNHKIISFEPVADTFSLLKSVAEKDGNWEAVNLGLGDKNESLTINVAKNSQSSSFLDMHETHIKARPNSVYIAEQLATIKRLDELLPQIVNGNERIMLKIDTQGYEKKVIDGCEGIFNMINLIQMEMNLTTLYIGELDFVGKISYLNNLGFELVSIESGFSDSNGRVLTVDGIFQRKPI
jgi:FkbM family methyltransferase